MTAYCRGAVFLIVMLTTGFSDVLALQFSLSAMACCAKAHHQCAGLRTPDDCCQSMGQGVGASVTTPPAARVCDTGPALAILPGVTPPTATAARAIVPSATFKRPHDPPHLHPVALLI